MNVTSKRWVNVTLLLTTLCLVVLTAAGTATAAAAPACVFVEGAPE